MYTFPERMGEVEKDVKALDQACAKMMEENFHELLEMILLLGNYLNSNSSKGMARGFKISNLNKASLILRVGKCR
jgi:hypothetical protein